MEYGIRELSALAGVSARTLRYYDEIGLLKPLRVNEAGYRFYGEAEVTLLQQILFYRERGFELKTIGQILYQETFDLVQAMEEHLLELEKQRAQTELLIETVKKTLRAMKGEYEMSDQEKFQAFKEKAVRENEEKYGAEARSKYGDEAVDGSNQKMLNMSVEDMEAFQSLEQEILTRLEQAVSKNLGADSDAAKEIVELHKKWISMVWKKYDAQAHRGVAAMYVADERFTAYYDRNVSGCAVFLHDAVYAWVK